VPRILSTLLVLGLLTGTAAAFALTEGAKLEKTPVFGTDVETLFSPVCNCRTDHVRIFFKLRKAETVTVTIERGGREVRRLVSRNYRRGRVEVFWDGRDAAGRVQRDGTYIPVVHLGRSHRTIRLPNPIRIDTRPPRVDEASVKPLVFSPDGDGRADRITVGYRFDEEAHAVLLVNGRRELLRRSHKPADRFTWDGRIGGKPLRPGVYKIAIAARDLAENLGRARFAGRVQVRYVVLARTTLRVVAGGRFALRVSTDAPTVRWLLGGRRGTARRGTMRLRAPAEPGSYTLYVSANGHAARARVVVEARP
jgi:hypothetical protein